MTEVGVIRTTKERVGWGTLHMGNGRPNYKRTTRIMVPFSAEDFVLIRGMAVTQGISVAEQVRRLVKRGMA